MNATECLTKGPIRIALLVMVVIGTMLAGLARADAAPHDARLVADVLPGPSGSYADDLIAIGNTLFFSATTPESGHELWRYDGRKASQVADVAPGPEGSNAQLLLAHEGFLYFRANDGTSGSELWRSDGTSVCGARCSSRIRSRSSAAMAT